MQSFRPGVTFKIQGFFLRIFRDANRIGSRSDFTPMLLWAQTCCFGEQESILLHESVSLLAGSHMRDTGSILDVEALNAGLLEMRP